MSALYGFTGTVPPEPSNLLDAMADASRADSTARSVLPTPLGTLGAAGQTHASFVDSADGSTVALVGHPRYSGLADNSSRAAIAAAFLRDWRSTGLRAASKLGGDFALALHDVPSRTTVLLTDRIGTHPITYAHRGAALLFGSSLDAIGCDARAALKLRPAALYEYLYFHAIPAPATVYEHTWRLLPGHAAVFCDSTLRIERYWQMQFDEQPIADRPVRERDFVDTIAAAVAHAAQGARCGAFLSGGTDSSTVAGMLVRATGHAHTYSIGFAEAGYDEMHYARIAARHFGTKHHELYVTAADVFDAAPRIATWYDQPFGNSSAIPTYLCTKMARADGVDRMIGGDGGDELFGGNSRYAKQHLFAHYARLPASVRHGLIEPLLIERDWAARWPGWRKLRSYVEQARPPMPRRYESYNLLDHLSAARVFAPDFLAQIDRNAPHALLDTVFAPYANASLINQMLGIDLRFTLADNDLPKVARMCALAGADITFPLLDDAVVAFSSHLPAREKLRGARLRPFFKEALRDFLPAEIITKQKHGFGLPIGPWLARDPALQTLTGDALSWLRGQRVVRPEFIDELLTQLLPKHPPYYGTMAWLLVVLSLWMQSRRVSL